MDKKDRQAVLWLLRMVYAIGRVVYLYHLTELLPNYQEVFRDSQSELASTLSNASKFTKNY